MKFQKKPVIVDAVQWFKLGDHPLVLDYHTAWDFGFRSDDSSEICNVNNAYTGCGVFMCSPSRFKLVHPGDYVVMGETTYVTDAEDFLSEFEDLLCDDQ